MALSVTILPDGLHHAVASGQITVGLGFGEVPAVGAGQLMRLRLPFDTRVFVPVGFEEQFYVISKSLDGNVTDIRVNAVPFEYDSVSPILRLDVDILMAPATVQMWLEAHHSIGR